jgi:AcrR family transcriptional regulator
MNPVKFDRDKVIELACALFWEKGFNGTSTRDIQQTVNMRPGSIYAAFGSKQGLYIEAVEYYANMMKSILNEYVNNADSSLSGLEMFVRHVLIDNTEGMLDETCMLVKGSIEFNSTTPILLTKNQHLLAEFENTLCRIFETAIQNAELSDAHDALDYARSFQIQFTGIRSYIKRGSDHLVLDKLITQLFEILKRM